MTTSRTTSQKAQYISDSSKVGDIKDFSSAINSDMDESDRKKLRRNDDVKCDTTHQCRKDGDTDDSTRKRKCSQLSSSLTGDDDRVLNPSPKLYECDVCYRNFRLQTALVQHTIAKHPEKGPYVCETCDHCSTNEVDLWHHMADAHPIISDPLLTESDLNNQRDSSIPKNRRPRRYFHNVSQPSCESYPTGSENGQPMPCLSFQAAGPDFRAANPPPAPANFAYASSFTVHSYVPLQLHDQELQYYNPLRRSPMAHAHSPSGQPR